MKRAPKFREYMDGYLKYFGQVKNAKRPATVKKESGALKLWAEDLGELRLDKISRCHINAFIAKGQAANVSGRTVNLDVITLRNLLKRAIDDGWIKVAISSSAI